MSGPVHGDFFFAQEDSEHDQAAIEDGVREDGDADAREEEGPPRPQQLAHDDDDPSNNEEHVEGSAHAQWPQSYRHSIDVYSHMASPSIPRFFSASASGQEAASSSSFRSPLGSLLQRRNSHQVDPAAAEPLLSPDGRSALPPPPPPPPAGSIPILARKRSEPRTVAAARAPLPPRADEAKGGLHVDSGKWSEDDEVYFVEAPERKGSSFMQTVLNGVNVLAGVGVLSTPYAVMEGGWLGLLLLLALALICCYTGLLLRRCLDSSPGLETYPDIGQAAFGSRGRLLISIVLYTELYACCVEFLILEGDNLSALFPGAGLRLGATSVPARHLFVLVSAICILPTVWLRDLSILSYVSAGGVIASVVVVLCVAWVGAVDRVGFRHDGPLIDWGGVPVALGLYGFCYSGHAVFPNLYTSMKMPEKFGRVLLISFALCTVIYGGIAVMGFTMFGEATQSQITLNLPERFVASEVALWTTVVNPFTKYALTMTPVALCLEELLPLRSSSQAYRTASLCIRSALVASTVAVALLVPFFGFVMAFIGSFLSMTVSVILPCACYLRILGKRTTAGQAVLCSCIMAFGLVFAVAGTYSSVAGIVNSMRQPAPAPGPPPSFVL